MDVVTSSIYCHQENHHILAKVEGLLDHHHRRPMLRHQDQEHPDHCQLPGAGWLPDGLLMAAINHNNPEILGLFLKTGHLGPNPGIIKHFAETPEVLAALRKLAVELLVADPDNPTLSGWLKLDLGDLGGSALLL